jgi:hypothetical protein
MFPLFCHYPGLWSSQDSIQGQQGQRTSDKPADIFPPIFPKKGPPFCLPACSLHMTSVASNSRPWTVVGKCGQLLNGFLPKVPWSGGLDALSRGSAPPYLAAAPSPS